jgi:hypothetical protein
MGQTLYAGLGTHVKGSDLAEVDCCGTELRFEVERRREVSCCLAGYCAEYMVWFVALLVHCAPLLSI